MRAGFRRLREAADLIMLFAFMAVRAWSDRRAWKARSRHRRASTPDQPQPTTGIV